MRYAIFSDIHGNLQAWNAIREDMVDLQADVLVCLGDVVGYGPLPEEVLAAIRAVTPNFVLGNHDAAAVGLLDPALFNASAEAVIKWTSAQLSDDSKQFLLETPLAIEEEELFFVHAELNQPGLFGYVETAEDAQANFAGSAHFVTFIGHTHHPLIFDLDRDGEVHTLPDRDLRLDRGHRYIVNVGSVGEPRNPDDIRARYVIYDSDTHQVYFRRIEFDPEAYRRDLAATSLDITPYFLRVVDHQAALESEAQHALMIDMQAPASLPNYATHSRPAALTRRILLPDAAGVSAHPKPKPTPSLRRPSPWPMVGVFLVILLVGALGYFVFFAPGRGTAPDLVVAEPAAAPAKPKSAASRREERVPADSQPADEVPEKMAARRDPGPATELVVVRNPPTDPPTAPATAEPPIPIVPPQPEEIPSVKTPPDAATTTLAYWRMEAESEDGSLPDQSGAHPLKQLTPARLIAAIAPDPIPLGGEQNSQASTLAAWIDPSGDGAFAITASRSFTFEGWILADKPTKPIYIAGTQTGVAPGWRLDLSAAKDAKSRGSIRFHLQGGDAGEPVSVQSDDIDLFEPVAHHFAILWHHDHAPEAGRAQVYYDGLIVAEGDIPHASLSADQANFRIGDRANPDRVAIDEFRFTAEILEPGAFLNRGRSPATLLPPAIMIDVGLELGTYSGDNSPAHRDGAVPINQTTWTYANDTLDRKQPTRRVRVANGAEYPHPLTIDLGRSDAVRPEDGIDWSNQGGETIRAGDHRDSLFSLDLMDSAQDPDGERDVGIRVSGLEPGDYSVYFSPLVADELGEDIRFGIGVDLASDPHEVTDLGAAGMQEISYIGGTASDKDTEWVLDRNYFKRDVTVTSADDYIVAIVAHGEASTAIPFLQIVRRSP